MFFFCFVIYFFSNCSAPDLTLACSALRSGSKLIRIRIVALAIRAGAQASRLRVSAIIPIEILEFDFCDCSQAGRLRPSSYGHAPGLPVSSLGTRRPACAHHSLANVSCQVHLHQKLYTFRNGDCPQMAEQLPIFLLSLDNRQHRAGRVTSHAHGSSTDDGDISKQLVLGAKNDEIRIYLLGDGDYLV